MKTSYRRALLGSNVGYACQAVTNNLPPLLFVIFQDQFNFSTTQISLLIICNFFVQILIDAVCAGILEKIGYKISFIAANLLCATGIASLGILPFVMPSPMVGCLTSITLYACGGGAAEVLITPIVNALPTKNPTRTLCVTHSCYCWGHVLVVILSTVYFTVFGTLNWRWLPMLWALLPLTNGIAFLRAETPSLEEEGGESGDPFKRTFACIVAVLFLMMLCAGASEVAMAEWSSYFAERSLGVAKTTGDILGPCLFAFLMGGARLIYGFWGERIAPWKVVLASALGCTITYVVAAASSIPIVSLVACGVTGFFVGPLWPGTLRMAGDLFHGGNTRLFALMALFGDLGCGVGPAVVGLISGSLAQGLLIAAIFPGLLMLCSLLGKKKSVVE